MGLNVAHNVVSMFALRLPIRFRKTDDAIDSRTRHGLPLTHAFLAGVLGQALVLG
jgi:hypothetical protein